MTNKNDTFNKTFKINKDGGTINLIVKKDVKSIVYSDLQAFLDLIALLELNETKLEDNCNDKI